MPARPTPPRPVQDSSNDEVREDLYRRFTRRGRWRLRFRRFIQGASWVIFVQLISGGKRILEWFSAFIAILILLPVFALLFLLVRVTGGSLIRVKRLGRWGEPFHEFMFSVPREKTGRLILWLHLHRLPALLNILKGDMSFIGPRVVSPEEISLREHAARKRYNVRPGLICLWWIRKRANIAYGDEFESDSEYVETHSIWGDLGITLRSIPAILYGEGVATAPDEIRILGIPIHNVTMGEAIEEMVDFMGRESAQQVCFVNADCANIAYKNSDYLGVLQRADLSLADGIGLKLGGKLLGRDIKQNVNGTDLFPRLCEALADTDYGLYLLGARPGVTDRVCNWIAKHYPAVRVCGAHHGYYTPEEEPGIIEDISRSGASMLLVAFGAPKQDEWIARHLPDLGVKAAMGVGGLFDFYSGRISRAPQWMREMGLEWVYRFYKEPRRMWKRYGIGNVLFLYRVIKEKFLGIAP